MTKIEFVFFCHKIQIVFNPNLLWCTLYMYVHAKFQHYQEKQLKAVQKSQEKRAKAFVAPKEDAAPPKKKQKVSGIVNCFLLLLSSS